ncbi:DUF1499 domain-containing protein [Piscinibacter sp.]|uniref:DUF1499 domain-containing protein n=1 Tax=Piscinibacter sp. TaxID=1903157 RepID=UPI002BFEE304|nr:DUF1499 domain-containing protein [Albitalea sp.]HUG24199.1 DUF1499 domain-containing protein [Albitalea sp.]
MTAADPNPDSTFSRTARGLAWLGLAVAVASAAAALVAGPAYRLEWMSLGTSFLVLRWATYGAIASIVVGIVAWVLLTVARAPRGRAIAVVASVLGVLVAAPPLAMLYQAKRLPNIHDISTDTNDPPAFVDVLPSRHGARNPVDYEPETAVEQRRGYPDIAPLRLAQQPAEAFERAERAARAMGWEIVAAKPEALRIEATDTTLFFGFKDDIVIRIRPQPLGSVVDVRSLSRVGGSDIGANARRVRAFLGKLAAD